MTTSSSLASLVHPAPVDLGAVKARQQGAWASGDYAVVGTTLQIVGEQFCEALDVRSGQRILDVAAGNGNASLAAARRWCDVVSTDYVPALPERGRERAEAERLAIDSARPTPRTCHCRQISLQRRPCMHVIIWDYDVPDELRKAFEQAYGPGGDRARLFALGEGYAGTDLLHDPAVPARYVTIDRWHSEDSHARFMASFRDRYGSLDKACEAFMRDEKRVGTFQLLGRTE
ncbi:MAG: hypothetical protein ACK4KW_01660 [Gemmobacter sp.]